MNYDSRLDVANAPLRILRQRTKQTIALKLDARKLLLAESKLHRDWRGLAEKADIDTSAIRCSKISPTEHAFHLWIQKGGLIKDLWNALECIDRYDVIDDTVQLIYDDFDHSLSREILGLKALPPTPDDIHPTITEFDSNVLTTDDQRNLNEGGTLQFYDALVLFADEDLDFVDEMVQKLEGEYKLKLCLKDRDLVGGLSFESSALIRLIEERCARVIVVLSPAFLSSNANKFLTQFAHALSIEHQRRIVIPCMVKPCQKPSEISYCHSLDYFRTKGYWDYWQKLADSITYKNTSQRIPNIPSGALAIGDLPSPSPSDALSSVTSTSLPSSSSNGVIRRFLKKAEGHDKKSSEVCAKSSPINILVTSDSGLSLSTSTSFEGSSCRSRSPVSSSSPFLSNSYDKRIKNVFKNVFKKKKKKAISS